LTDAVTQSDWDVSNPDSMFEYLHLATFGTFDAFVGMDSVYKVQHDAESEGNVALKYKNSTSDGLNFSVNYINGLDTNPYIDLSWETQAGVKLYENSNTSVGEATVRLSTTQEADGAVSSTVGGLADGGTAGVAGADLTKLARMVMTEKLARIQSLGGSFDTAIETAQLGPIVLRGEALYQMDVKTPIITRKAANNKDLEHGFFTAAFANHDTDYFKYVLGADITALTNMMISAQFIQIVNLDYVNEGSITHTDTWRYTGDTAAMHLTNGLQAAEEFKEFYSLFLSKPFGASGEHRWNNILMAEDGGGYWNRLDAEFSIDDDTQVTLEMNHYFGDENTQFGQLSASSNIQVGFKYSF
jgi:hypothetical protein